MRAHTPNEITKLRERGQPVFHAITQAHLRAPNTFNRKFRQYARAAGLTTQGLKAKLLLVDWAKQEHLKDQTGAMIKRGRR